MAIDLPPGSAAPRLIAFNKPFGVICQFSSHDRHPSLADHIQLADVYPAGRLDTDSEGLLLLTAQGALQHAIAHPTRKLEKRYWAQVEGTPRPEDLARLRSGVALGDFITLPCAVNFIEEPGEIWPRNPPIRVRRAIPTCWLEIAIVEGKNRQVRRMTAAIGLPTLRLIRHSIGPVSLGTLEPGQWRAVEPAAIQAIESHYATAREVPGRGSFAPRKRSPLPTGEKPRTSPRRRTGGPRS